MQTDPPKADPPKRRRRWFQFSLRTLFHDSRPARPLYRILAVIVAVAYTAATLYVGIERGLPGVVWSLIPIYVFCTIAFTGRLPSFRIKAKKPNGSATSNTQSRPILRSVRLILGAWIIGIVATTVGAICANIFATVFGCSNLVVAIAATASAWPKCKKE